MKQIFEKLLPSALFLSLRGQKLFFEKNPKLRYFLLGAGIIGIILWQVGFYIQHDRLDSSYRNRASLGTNWQPHFVFFYVTGLFPVRSLSSNPLPSGKENLLQLIHEYPQSITAWTIPNERLSLYFYYPSTWLRGSPYQADLRITNAAAFILSLVFLYIGCWYAGLEILGIFLVLLLGSNPYELFEIYSNQNVFGWPILASLLILTPFLPILWARPLPRHYGWLTALAAGIVTGSARHIRPESLAMILAAATGFFWMVKISWKRKIFLAFLCLFSFMLTSKGWEYHWTNLQSKTHAVLAEAGVKISQKTPEPVYHVFWMSVLEGLGDFDTKYGYLWDDRVSYALAQKYKLPPCEACRKKILSDLSKDPGWFLTILAKRTWRILAENTPPRISAGSRGWNIPLPGWLVIVFMIYLTVASFFRREYRLLSLVVFLLPTAAAPLLIFSDYGVSHYSVVHLGVAAILATLIAEEMIRIFKLNNPNQKVSFPSGSQKPLRPS
ncbi:MAG: hypothetical protein HYZ84_06720 [Candidatus Omnitrophica bacterium]|nr:hypothetical protein [Candidatus Omnitrophota bacterium]